jgi:hypothetical protein
MYQNLTLYLNNKKKIFRAYKYIPDLFSRYFLGYVYMIPLDDLLVLLNKEIIVNYRCTTCKSLVKEKKVILTMCLIFNECFYFIV